MWLLDPDRRGSLPAQGVVRFTPFDGVAELPLSRTGPMPSDRWRHAKALGETVLLARLAPEGIRDTIVQ
jgi:hypothetical protein